MRMLTLQVSHLGGGSPFPQQAQRQVDMVHGVQHIALAQKSLMDQGQIMGKTPRRPASNMAVLY